MDVITAIKLYINKMTNESGPGMKILLMDKDTVFIIIYTEIENKTICLLICFFLSFLLLFELKLNQNKDQHHFDGIQPIGYVAKGSLSLRTN